MQVIDVSTPSQPVIIGSIDISGYTEGVAVMGNTAFLAKGFGGGGLQIIDVSMPSKPVIIGSVETPGSAQGVTVIGDIAFVTCAYEWSGLQVVDVSTPSHPVIIGSADTPGDAFEVTVIGDIALFTAVHALAWPIPDTGQTQCYDDRGNEITCPQLGEDFYGQGGNYTINPPSYTKLDTQGDDLSDDATEWVTWCGTI